MSEENVEIVRAHLVAFRSLQDPPRTVSSSIPTSSWICRERGQIQDADLRS